MYSPWQQGPVDVAVCVVAVVIVAAKPSIGPVVRLNELRDVVEMPLVS